MCGDAQSHAESSPGGTNADMIKWLTLKHRRTHALRHYYRNMLSAMKCTMLGAAHGSYLKPHDCILWQL